MDSYDRDLHIAAIFIIFATSFIGAVIPLVASKLWQSMDTIYLSCGKMFGAGVILATGFIHLFAPADQVLLTGALHRLNRAESHQSVSVERVY